MQILCNLVSSSASVEEGPSNILRTGPIKFCWDPCLAEIEIINTLKSYVCVWKSGSILARWAFESYRYLLNRPDWVLLMLVPCTSCQKKPMHYNLNNFFVLIFNNTLHVTGNPIIIQYKPRASWSWSKQCSWMKLLKFQHLKPSVRWASRETRYYSTLTHWFEDKGQIASYRCPFLLVCSSAAPTMYSMPRVFRAV